MVSRHAKADSLNFAAVRAVRRGGIFDLTINDVSLLQTVARMLGMAFWGMVGLTGRAGFPCQTTPYSDHSNQTCDELRT